MVLSMIKLIKRGLIAIYFIIYIYVFGKTKKIMIKRKDYFLIKEYKTYLDIFLNLKEKPLNLNDSLISEEKENIFKFISNSINKNVSFIKKIIFTAGANFGNILLCLNKLIFFCELIECSEISLQNKAFWFIKNRIILKDYNITINPNDETKYPYLEDQKDLAQDTIYYNSFDIFFYLYKIKPEIRIHLLKDEIIKNIPELNISRNDLYIHIRSGDIFTTYIHEPYAQPPLCFYTKIFESIIFKNLNFNKIYLLSTDNNNPTINKLLSKFKNIIYTNNKLEYDLSCLMNSYNLVGSISSFLNTVIILNPNLENLWDYNIYQMNEKILQNHYDLYKFPNNFTIYRMEASLNYKSKMYIWKNNKIQRKLMIKEKCINSFMIISVL